MRKVITTILLFLILTQSFGQTQRKVSTYLLTQYNNTLYDYTIGNNPWGIGLALQTFCNDKTRFKPTIELTGDIYLEDDKVLKLDPDGSVPKNDNSISGMINIFVGSSFHPTQSLYLSFVAGPCFIDGQTLVGLKPSIGFYFSGNQRWTSKLSYINIFNRGKAKKDFGSVSLAISCKLF